MKQLRTPKPTSRRVGLRLTEKLYEQVERQAIEAGCSINALLNQFIEDGAARTKFSAPPEKE